VKQTLSPDSDSGQVERERERESIGVVVQGPLLSVGRTLRDVSPKIFNCAAEIENTYKHATDLGFKFVLVTWEDEYPSECQPNIPADSILKIYFPSKRLLFRLFNNWKNNNKYKQYYSTLAGLNLLKELGCTYVVKVRTDSHLDLVKFADFYSKMQKNDLLDKIFVPAMNLEKPDLFMDYYFGSRAETLRIFLKTVLDCKELYSNVHFDTFYKYTKSRLDLSYFKLRQNLYKTEKKRLGICGQNIIKQAWTECFTPGPFTLYESYRWRGETFGAVKTEELLFWEDVEKKDPGSTSLELLNALDISFARMPKKAFRIILTSIPTFFVSSIVEENIVKTRSNIYRLNRGFRIKLKQQLRSGLGK
jgi:hypothetical protein